jgi:hypothetical protein
MNLELKTPPELEGLPLELPPHLAENFEKADRQLRELYGQSPGVQALVRLWLACGTSSRIRREFELAVLDIRKRGLNPNEEGNFDEDCL